MGVGTVLELGVCVSCSEFSELTLMCHAKTNPANSMRHRGNYKLRLQLPDRHVVVAVGITDKTKRRGNLPIPEQNRAKAISFITRCQFTSDSYF